jgi:hypothetical protein
LANRLGFDRLDPLKARAAVLTLVFIYRHLRSPSLIRNEQRGNNPTAIVLDLTPSHIILLLAAPVKRVVTA